MIPRRNLKRFTRKAFQQPVYAWEVLVKRLSAYFSYSLVQGRSSLPEAITLFLTHRCNLRCKMCGQWGEAGVTRHQGKEVLQEELSLESVKSLIDDLALCKPNITLFGGEPLLYEGCGELVRYIKSKNLHCLLITNGSLLENFAEELVRAGLDELNLSLDGSRELHEQIRGQPGLFERILKGLAKLNYVKARLNKSKPLINLQCTITRYNYEHLEQLVEVAGEIKASSLTFHNLIFLNRESLDKQKSFDELLGSSSADWEGFILEPGIDPLLLERKKKEILSGNYDFSVDFYPNFSGQELISYYTDPCFHPPGQNCRCLSPWLVAYIFPDGEVRPCLNLSYSFGNIRKEKFAAVWNSRQAIKFRRLLKTSKIFPVCARCTELYRY